MHVPERDTIERLRSPGPSGLNPESKAWCLIGGLGGGEGAREDSACCFFSFRGLYSSRREVRICKSIFRGGSYDGDASRQRCPLEEGMRPEDQERGRDRKKKKWERQTRSLFVAFYEGLLFVGHPCVCTEYVPILCYTDTAIQQTRTTKELNEQSTINRMNRINIIIINAFPPLILLFILAIAVYSKLTSTSRPPLN